MSLLPFLVVTIVAAAASLLLRQRREIAVAIGVLGLAVAFVAAMTIRPGEQLDIGGTTLATTAYQRLFLLLGCAAGLCLAVIGVTAGSRRDAPAVMLGTLASAALTLGLPDARVAILASTAGGLLGVLVTLVPSGARVGATVGHPGGSSGDHRRDARDRGGRLGRAHLGDLSAQPVVFGLAYLAFALAVAVRFGVIPFHFWAARLADAAPEVTLPVLTAWGPAALAVVALAWIDASVAPLLPEVGAERAVLIAIGLLTIVLAALAATIQDDLEHVLGYSIMGDAGVVAAGARLARTRSMGTGPDVDPRVRRGPKRLCGMGGGGSGVILDGTHRRPSRLGPALTAARSCARPHRRRQRRAPGLRRLGGALVAGLAAVRVALDGGRDPRDAAAARLLRPAACGRRCARPHGGSSAEDWLAATELRSTSPRSATSLAALGRANRGIGHRAGGPSSWRSSQRPTSAGALGVTDAADATGADVRSRLRRPRPPDGATPGLLSRGEHPAVHVALVVLQLAGLEPQVELGGRVLRAVRGVDDVLRGLEREVAADRARRGLVRPRRAVDRADDGDRVGPVERERDERSRT